ncbi:tRNA N(3)-methylcytidine methyltransferase METTL2-like isoform X1 [Pollicipes pollicipes]|uniref:tRNA N(3)-methylcytidine methyltransferase METTL2-like isoform X1 n=1 Tax=Pollicipes pollicipes TaxID=41117 RepID=UPI0018851D3B|nr:tRNA N(3)-methylcytidine methyltransferase METTL2-like isoform X1 [Pollicipes pollicipes]
MRYGVGLHRIIRFGAPLWRSKILPDCGCSQSLHCTKVVMADDKRPQFGNRTLKDADDVFKHNAWDNVEWDEEQQEEAQRKIDENASVKAEPDKVQQLVESPNVFWDAFYDQHDNKFFKDRNWLFTEFPELGEKNNSEDSAPQKSGAPYPGRDALRRVWEVGCGVGNTIFPLLETNADRRLFVYGSDFSESAVRIVRQAPQFDPDRCHAFVMDVTDEAASVPFPEASLDIIVLIFVLSALHPSHHESVARRLARYLRPGGTILLRDYGRYDMAQLRFKPGRCLQDNLYARGDGTLVYFFTQEELRGLFLGAGLEEVQNHVDRRLQVNRGRQLKMYRVWNQCKYRKPADTS